MNVEHPVSARLRLALNELPDCTGLVVALSGGLDSTVLLHALSGLAEARSIGLRACHVDHGLNSDSAAWVQHNSGFCESLGVGFSAVRVEVPESSLGVEGEARVRRYRALRSGLLVKMLKRTSVFENKSPTLGPPAAQMQKMDVPRKTKLFLDQTVRERESGSG